MPAPRPFPAIEEWQAPWEKNGTEFDAEVAKRLVYNLEKKVAERATDENAQSNVVQQLTADLEAARTELEARTTRVRELEDAAATSDAERQRLEEQRWRDELTATVKALAEGKALPGANPPAGTPAGTPAAEVTDTDRELALLRAGVPADEVAAHVKRVSGSTLEELTTDAKAYAVTLGYATSDDQSGDTRYDGGSGSREMPSDVPRRGGHRTDLGGALGGSRIDPATVRDLIPR